MSLGFEVHLLTEMRRRKLKPDLSLGQADA